MLLIKLEFFKKDNQIMCPFMSRKNSHETHQCALTCRYHMFLKLFGAMGLTWILELIAWIISQYTEKVPLALTIILNTPTVLQAQCFFTKLNNRRMGPFQFCCELLLLGSFFELQSVLSNHESNTVKLLIRLPLQ